MSKRWKLWIGIPLIVIGSLGLLLGVVLLSVLGPGGRLELPSVTLRSSGAALVLEERVAVGDLSWSSGDLSDLGSALEVRASSAGGNVFVGLALASDAAAFLADVPIERVTDLNFPGVVSTAEEPGNATATPPGEATFWLEADEGPGSRVVRRPFDAGEWWIVVMNADGSAGLDLRTAITLEVPALGGASIGFAVVGAIIAASGLGMLISALRGGRRRGAAASTIAPPPPGFGTPPRPDRPG